MFCVVQVIQRKKADPHGAYREYKVQSMSTCGPDGTTKTRYYYIPHDEKGRFERLHRESYKISIQESHRESGKVIKKQCVIGTIGYYELIECSLYDCIDYGIGRAAALFNVDYEDLYQLVENKMQPIIDKIQEEFHETDEYRTEKHRKEIIETYQTAKKQFAEKYGVDADEYDYCYNIFGELMDKQYLKQIIQKHEQQEAYRGYQKSKSSTYSGWSAGSYSFLPASTYTDEERTMLKEFFRCLCKLYHPDLNPEKDTTKKMQLLNKLKKEWGV